MPVGYMQKLYHFIRDLSIYGFVIYEDHGTKSLIPAVKLVREYYLHMSDVLF